jgi:hypothetical protein
LKSNARPFELHTWNDLFDIKQDGNTVLDILVKTFFNEEKSAVEDARNSGTFPQDRIVNVVIRTNDDKTEIAVQIAIFWKRFESRHEATLLDGSYCFTNDSFQGRQYGPVIDTRGVTPGEAWLQIDDSDIDLTKNQIMVIRYHGDIRRALREDLGPRFMIAKA